jgi:hypothetical protein
MSVTIGSVTLNTLTAQPFGYDESDTSRGQTARRFAISGLVSPSEWLDLLDEYDNWRNSRIDDEDPAISAVIGTTVNFSGTGPGSQSWSSVQCWFTAAPSAEQRGAWLAVNVELVSAVEALQVLLKQQEAETGGGGGGSTLTPDFGTFVIGGTTLTLTKPPDSYGAGPALDLTIGGTHYVSGTLTVVINKDIEGTTNLTGWNNIKSWYEATITTTPSSGSYFPVSVPSATAERVLIDGTPTDIYTVSVVLVQVI